MIERLIIKNYKGISDADILFKGQNTVIVGNNGVGKSTIIEALTLVLGYGLNKLELKPTTFHRSVWTKCKKIADLPEITIEVHFKQKPETDCFSGKNNSLKELCTGIRMKISFDDDYADSFEENKYQCIPCEYFKIERRWFSEDIVKQLFVPYSLLIIDSTTTFFNSRTDHYVYRLMESALSKEQQAKMKGSLRRLKEDFESYEDIKLINKVLNEKTKIISHDFTIGTDLMMRAADSLLVPFLDNIPISQIGLGDQCILKTILSLDSAITNNNKETIIIIEEPESHLSHTKMYELIGMLSKRNIEQQLIMTTHNNFVANKMDLVNLVLVNNTKGSISTMRLNSQNIDVYKFFFKASSYPTLRLALCRKAILVEGPTDEMVVLYHYYRQSKHPYKDGIELIVVGGKNFKNFIAIARDLNVKVAVITDNDGKTVDTVKDSYISYNDVNINVFTEANTQWNTIEPSFAHKNENCWNHLAKIVMKKKPDNLDIDGLISFMINNKTEWAFRLLESAEIGTQLFDVPNYIVNAIDWLNNE